MRRALPRPWRKHTRSWRLTKIDLLFVDLELMDDQEAGLGVAQAAAKTRQGLPVIYTIGRGITDGMLALFVKRNVFLAKPYGAEQLLTAVANVLK
jgi:DNA-binding NtrC family response regulator